MTSYGTFVGGHFEIGLGERNLINIVMCAPLGRDPALDPSRDG